MADTLTIRPAVSADLATIEQLARRIWPRCYQNIISAEQIEYMLQWMYSADQLQKDHAAGVSFLLLLHQTNPIGFAAWGPSPTSDQPAACKLHKLYLLPEFHHRGWGSRLLAAALDQARSRNFSHITLNVNKKNTAAIAAYQRHGFTIRQAVCVDIGHGFVMDDFLMETSLGAPMPNDNLADLLFARRNPDVSLANLADLLDRLTWLLRDGEEEVAAARARWLAGDDPDRVELALLMDETFPYDTKEEMDRQFARIAAQWPRLATLCRKIQRQWDQQAQP